MVTIQNYVRVKNLEEAYTLNQKKGSMILGGMLWTKMQDRTIQTAIDLCELGLDRIDENADAFFAENYDHEYRLILLGKNGFLKR